MPRKAVEAVEAVEEVEVKELEKAPKETETITIPRGGRGEDNYVIIRVNGDAYQIQKGIPVEVPKFVAEVWHNHVAATFEADEYIDSLESADE